MSHDDFETEPVPGLPAQLPDGEHIVWQGGSDRHAIWRDVFYRNWLIGYFAILAVWRIGVGLYDGASTASIIGAAIVTFVLAALALIITYGLSLWIEKTTIYTLTNKRLVMRFGMALPMTFNLPYTQITSADVLKRNKGLGTIALSLKEHTKITWPVLWPHARPWKISQPQPALRAIKDVDTVASRLVEGLLKAHAEDGKANVSTSLIPVAKPRVTSKPNSANDLPINGLHPTEA